MKRIADRILSCVAVAALIPASHRAAIAAPDPPPAGYTMVVASTAVPDSLVSGIGQLAWLPGDNAHLYAVRPDAGDVMRYVYAPDGTLSGPLRVASGLVYPCGLAFRGSELYVSSNAASDGRMVRLRDLDHNGTFEERVDFVRGIPLREHQVDQIQIRGSSLYVGIGTRSNGGLPTCERIYNGVIARIGDLTLTNFNGIANALPDSLTYINGAVSDGLLRRYAYGFRNPFGLRVDSLSRVWTSDNGASLCTTCSSCNNYPIDTPDFFYGPVAQGARGQFPPAGQPGGGGATMAPISNLGMHSAVAGFAWVSRGPDAGKILLAEFGPTDTSIPIGRDVVKIDPATGAVSPFIAHFNRPTEIVSDAAGRLLIADYDAPAVYLLTPPGTTGVGGDGASAGAIEIVRVEPNPTRGGAAIFYRLPAAAEVRVEIRDVAGRTVAAPFSGWQPAGLRQIAWNGLDARGRGVAPGLYFCKLRSAGSTAIARLVRIR